jgi:(p)ppGpp synthase/HD superfamily hydrolase
MNLLNKLIAVNEKAAAAYELAEKVHAGVERKYGGGPYLGHPVRVAGYVIGMIGEPEIYEDWAIDIVAAALLHDVIEDGDVKYEDLVRDFEWNVADMVKILSNPDPAPGVNRKSRKAYELAKMEKAGPGAKLIRLADILDNVPGVIDNDPKFAKVYVAEKRKLLPLLVGSGYPELFEDVFRVLWIDYKGDVK